MRYIFPVLLLGLSVSAGADTFTLKDGAKLEGEITGEMDGAVLVKTEYGSLTINKADIAAQQTAPAPAAVSPAAPVEISSAQPEAVTASTTAPAAGLSTAQPESVAAPGPKLTFQTILPSTTTRRLVYMENGVAIATETFDAAGGLIMTEGAIGNGTYREFFPDGSLKMVKTIMSGKANGTLKAFFPDGTLQIEAYYLAGGKEGPFKYYTEGGKLLLEAAYSNDLLNGWKKEYGADGAVLSEAYYIDNRLAAPEPAKAPEPASLVTARIMSQARGERFSFRLNNKYIGKAALDKDFNIISQEGRVPDGTVKVYAKDGSLQKELVFEKNGIKTLRVYAPGGALKIEYSYIGDKAVKK